MPIYSSVTDGLLAVAPSMVFDLRGPRFHLMNDRGAGDPFSPSPVNRSYVRGSVVSLGATFSGYPELGSGQATVDGVAFPSVFYLGAIRFGGIALLPSSFGRSGFISGDFSMAAVLGGFLADPFIGDPGPAQFVLALRGYGRATLMLRSANEQLGGGEELLGVAIVYRFSQYRLLVTHL